MVWNASISSEDMPTKIKEVTLGGDGRYKVDLAVKDKIKNAITDFLLVRQGLNEVEQKNRQVEILMMIPGISLSGANDVIFYFNTSDRFSRFRVDTSALSEVELMLSAPLQELMRIKSFGKKKVQILHDVLSYCNEEIKKQGLENKSVTEIRVAQEKLLDELGGRIRGGMTAVSAVKLRRSIREIYKTFCELERVLRR